MAKYGGHIIGKAGFEVGGGKDICQIGKDTNWFATAVSKKLENGGYTSF